MIENNYIFPTSIGITKVPYILSQEELSFILSIEMKRSDAMTNINSKSESVLDNKELSELKKYLSESVNQYFLENYRPTQPLSLEITTSWTNITNLSESQLPHFHRDSVISGVFYVQTNDELDRITFFTPSRTIYRFNVDEYNLVNSDTWWIPAKTGHLVMFPAYLEHGVLKKDHPGSRISLAFDTRLEGNIGDSHSRVALKF